MALVAIGRLPEPSAVRRGIATTRIAGRFQVIEGDVPVVLDIAHNPHAARSLAGILRESPPAGRDIAVAGLLEDKDAAGVVDAVGDEFAAWFVARPQGARGKPAEVLARTVRERARGVSRRGLRRCAERSSRCPPCGEVRRPDRGVRLVLHGR